MQSRRDQVQAYFFVVGRMIAAVTHGRPDALVQPNRRTSTGVVLGVLLGAVIAGIFGIYGLFVPGGNDSWRTPGSVIAAEETGARYLYLDGQLRPVLNYASARLAGATAEPVVSVAGASLAGTPTGRPIGIPGAPDGVPAPDGLDAGPWVVCALPPVSPADPGPGVAVLVGAPPGTPLGEGQGVLVSAPDGARHLLWQGMRFAVPDQATLGVLGYDGVTPVPVATSWLDTVPAGRELGVPPTPGAGEPGPVIDGRPSVVGQVLAVRNPALESEQLYLVRADGITPVSESAAALLLAADSTAAAYPGRVPEPVPVGPGALNTVPDSTGPDLATGLPARPPAAAAPPEGAVPCARHTPGPDGTRVTVELRTRDGIDASSVPLPDGGPGGAGRVAIPTGGGALVRGEGAAAASTSLVTGTGTRYPVADEDALGALGLAGAPVTTLPRPVLDLLPSGPVLSIDAARADAGA